MSLFYLEISTEYNGVVMRMQFGSRRSAENARRKLAKEMAKGKFKNDADVVEIKGDTGTMSVRPSTVVMAQVVDQVAWDDTSKSAKDDFYARHPDERPKEEA